MPFPLSGSLTPQERRRKRCFHRVISGLEKGGSLRLITLTSSPEAPEDIQRSFRKLIMRLRRRGLLDDYIKAIETTDSWLEHIHMVFRGSYIEQKLLSYLWSEIHNSPVVDIRKVKSGYKNKRGVANYLAKYMSKEMFRRYSWSWGWVYKGFVKTWVLACRVYRQINDSVGDSFPFLRLLRLWKGHLKRGSPPQTLLGNLRFLQERASLANPMP